MPREREIVLANRRIQRNGHIVASITGDADVELHIVSGTGDVVVRLSDSGWVNGAGAFFQKRLAMAGIVADEAVL